MPIVISSKGSDINAWRAAGNFGATFRQVLLDKTGTLTSGQAEALFRGVEQELERHAAEHDAAMAALQLSGEAAAAATEPVRLGELIREFYGACYALFSHNRSAAAFYRVSSEFLGVVAGTLLACAVRRLNPPGGTLPPPALIALGPAGRHEFSPFCSLQLLLINGENGPAAVELGLALQEVFEEAGLRLDQVVTPSNPHWCGTPAQWRQRLMAGPERDEPSELVDLFRLADQTALFPAGGAAEVFGDLSLSVLRKNHVVLAFLVARIQGLSNGIGIMGGLHLEKLGPHRGLFALFDHALLPFSASVTVLSLIMGGTAVGTPQRIRELLAGGKLNVEQAERLLEAWHTLNELRLDRERELFPDWSGQSSLYLDPESMSDAVMERFREALDIVAVLQRHVTITFSRWEEQTAC